MESAGRLRHQEPHPARAASEPAPSDAYVGNPGGLPGTQERRRTRHPNALARVAISRTPHRHVETPRSYGALATCVQPKIWVTISPRERVKCFENIQSRIPRPDRVGASSARNDNLDGFVRACKAWPVGP